MKKTLSPGQKLIKDIYAKDIKAKGIYYNEASHEFWFPKDLLDMKLEFTHEYSSEEYIRIGMLPLETMETGTISLLVINFLKNKDVRTLQACLTAKEIDSMIKGLQSAKKRMAVYQRLKERLDWISKKCRK